MKGRQFVGGSPSGVRSIDFSLEFKVVAGSLTLTDADPELARRIVFATAPHPDLLDHPLVIVRRPRDVPARWPEAPRPLLGAARVLVAVNTPWPAAITAALPSQPGRQQRILRRDDVPLEALLLYRYFELLDWLAKRAKVGVLEGTTPGAPAEAAELREEVGDARVAAWAARSTQPLGAVDRQTATDEANADIATARGVYGIATTVEAEQQEEDEAAEADEEEEEEEEEEEAPPPAPPARQGGGIRRLVRVRRTRR